jgi:hypothetical protein
MLCPLSLDCHNLGHSFTHHPHRLCPRTDKWPQAVEFCDSENILFVIGKITQRHAITETCEFTLNPKIDAGAFKLPK